ncbi:MAG TPA: metallopeptidase TldD-related protein [Roseiflexaceae bacterium]|nr:metallopeptidase TldD-related protein [Roseiflexaceae bacterium]
MLERIVAALQARADLAGWSAREIRSRQVQLYAVPNAIEARRAAMSERYVIQILRQTGGSDGSARCGDGSATLLPGDDIEAAIDTAALTAGLVQNQPYGLPEPGALPDVPLADPQIQSNAGQVLDQLHMRLRAAVLAQPHVQLTAAELYAEEQTIHFRNSRGLEATQIGTAIDLEWVLLCRDGAREAESFVELRRRRLEDIDVEAEVASRARHAADLLRAGAPPDYLGAVVLRGATLATFLNGGVIQTLASAATKFAKLSRWEVGEPVFHGQADGDPLTVFANRRLPFGNHAGRFDNEGQPAQRVELIRYSQLAAFTANQRYAEYLGIPATGDFGDIELPAGITPAVTLLDEPHVEVVDFSWFTPDEITGDFSSEIRLGYLVEGDRRTPFKGGALVGNVLDALANARWSAETGFFGDYQGPHIARFAGLRVAGGEV